MEHLGWGNPKDVVGEYTEIMPGRATMAEHRHPFDEIREHYDSKRADILTKLHVLTIISGEQQTMNFYMNIGNRMDDKMGRSLYQEIAQIEEQHVSHYESLADPDASWFEMLVLHEYNECYMYYSCLETETDSRAKQTWQHNLDEEIEHLRIAVELMKQHERRDAREFLPSQLPELTKFQSNKDYVRSILAKQVDLTGKDTKYVKVFDLPKNHRYFGYQNIVNGDSVPSRDIVQAHINHVGHDYRLETEGPHPVERMRSHETVAV
jgi:rubrerythrin